MRKTLIAFFLILFADAAIAQNIGDGLNNIGSDSGSGGVSSVTAADGSVTVTPTTGAVTVSAAVNSINGATSVSALTISGTPFSGGTATTTLPLVYMNKGAAPSTWSTSGTEFGINAPSGFTGNFFDTHVNGGASVFNVSSTGTITAAGAGNFTGSVSSGTALVVSALNGNIYIPGAFTNGNLTTPAYLFGGATGVSVRTGIFGISSGAIAVNGNYGGFVVGSSPVTTSASGTNAWLNNATINPIGAVTSGGAAITNTSDLYVGPAATAGTNNYQLYLKGTSGDIGLTGKAPAVTTCGGGSLVSGSTDNKFTITGITAATACTITFSSALPAAPVCIFNTSTGIAVGGIPTTAAVTTTMAALTGTLQGICL